MKFLWSIILLSLLSATAFCQEREIYVSDAANFATPPWKILKYDQNGENGEVFIDQNLAWPQDILFLEDEKTVLISNLNTGQITRYDSETGAYIDTFAAGIGGPTRMKIGPDGLLYVLQWSGNGKVRRYQLDGTWVDDFTSVGVLQSIGLDWDSSGNLYVSSFANKAVRKFDPNGGDLGLFVVSKLRGPTNIWFADNGDLLVSDYSGTAIKRFDSSGNYVSDFIQGLSNSEGIGFFPNGNILIGNGATSSVKMFTSAGEYIEDIISTRSANLQTPNAVVVRELSAEPGIEINVGLSDAWFNTATNGQGFFITVFPGLKQMFLAWFTYDTERPPENVTAVVGEPGHRWVTAQGPYDGDTASLTVFVTEGGVFDSPLPAATTDEAGDGTMTLEFPDCTEGLVTYAIASLEISGEIPIQRVAPDNISLCETLLAQ
jgi:sugar lactone lactonase YvrE